jgi:hypothetical protein
MSDDTARTGNPHDGQPIRYIPPEGTQVLPGASFEPEHMRLAAIEAKLEQVAYELKRLKSVEVYLVRIEQALGRIELATRERM